MAEKRSVTIRELAQAAGVSIGTVSRALKGQPGLSDETRAEVLVVPGDGADTPPSSSARERDSWAATPQIFVTAAERELFEMLQAVVVDAGNTTDEDTCMARLVQPDVRAVLDADVHRLPAKA